MTSTSVPSRPAVDLSPPAVEDLAASVIGPVFLPGDPGYDIERAVFNLSVEHHPAVIVGATCAADVQHAVGFAAAQGLPVAVQATGHGPAVGADAAVLVTTRRMDAVHVDPEARTARVEAGVRWQTVIDAAALHGLAPLNGSSPLVGVVGYTLGGGLGPMGRAYGYAADHVRVLEIVTADGQLRRANAVEHEDLFWGVRGGKGNFGIVTALEFDLVPVARLYGGGLYFDGQLAPQVLHAYRTWTEQVPDTMTSSVALLRLPPVPAVPEPLRGRLVVHVRIAYLGSAGEGEDLVAPLRAVGERVIDTVAEMPYTDVAAIHADPTDPLPAYERTMMLSGLDGPAVDALLELVGPGSDSDLLLVELRQLGGALARQPAVPNAVGNRDAAFSLFTIGVVAAEDAAATLAYQDQVLARMEPWATGGRYLNQLAGFSPPGFVRDAYTREGYERLVELKSTYDPTNMFRLNHNIGPRS
jgi:FAD/FMN-containing dehydrogenase